MTTHNIQELMITKYIFHLILSNETKGTIQTQNPKEKTIICNKVTQMTRQHEPPGKPEVKLGAPEGQAFSAPHTAPVTMSTMSYQGMKYTHDNNNIAKRYHQPWWPPR